MKPRGSPVIDLCARFSRATARAEAMLDLAPLAGVDLRKMNEVRRRLALHEHEYDRTPVASRRRELVRLMDQEISVLAVAYKKLAAVVDWTATT